MNVQGIQSQGMALPPSATTQAAAPSNSTNQTPAQNANDAEQTFINLLVTELQSQDPTSPMDPTTMVGQMFQMNQLQQLIDINQTLSTALSGPAASSSSSTSSSAAAAPANSSAAAVSSNPSAALSQAATTPSQAAALYAQQ